MQRRDFGLVIIRSALVGDHFCAGDTPVDDHPALGSAKVHSDRFHQSAAGRSSVSRTMFIHVFTPKTLRTVVAATPVFQRLHRSATVLTDERFLADNEWHERMIQRSVSQVSCFIVFIPHLCHFLGTQISKERFNKLIDEYCAVVLGQRLDSLRYFIRDEGTVVV